ncbi:MAG TPA: oligosaccharide flippase family protein [Bacteroidia bacterium]|nr:oligosaccharide flippase family protein [Bacteroidia bacterium]HNP98212.1 oligosaccharide flippase family protein [Bacteroidia bacterium]
MISFLKRQFRTVLFRNTLIYGFGALFLKGISFFLIPLYTRLLRPEDYGHLELLNTFTSILEIVCSLGLFNFLYMDFFHQKDSQSRVRLMNSVLSIYLSISGILYLLTLIILWFNHEFFLGSISIVLVYFSIFTSYLNFFQGIYILVLKLSEKVKRVTILQIVLGVLSMSLNILFVYYLRTGIAGIIWANLICTVISLIIISSSIRNQFRDFVFSISISQVKNILRLSLPFIPGALSYWLLNSANRWILLHYGTLAEVGLYSLAIKFTSIFDPLIIQPFLNANNPRTLKQFSEGNYSQKLTYLYPGVIVFFGIMSFVVLTLAKYMIDPSFSGSLPLIPIMVTGTSLSVLAQITALLLLFRKKVGQTFTSIVAGSIVSISASFLLVPHFGSIGAAYGTIIGNFVWFAFILIFYLRERNRMKLPLQN